uniref:ATP synthase complex subunit 8 n=1 Tax=Conomurex luhuanus TaxID=69696 RepID=A0A222AKA9_CONLU|nr:ATP synthase F0 subunit 8 [Conomurex luhuanus]ASO76830.1 ATP synthase F0 subunit 8 [Conomurex luhuanus]
MPQLSPLNWIFLFLLFWTAVLTMSIILWWSSKVYYRSSTSASATFKGNKWNW